MPDFEGGTDASFLMNVNTFAPRDGSSGNTRIMDFYASDTNKDITLLLMFQPPPVGKLYVDMFPVAWKVISFSGTGINSASVTYTADTGFFVPQMNQSNLVAASTSQHCQTGQKCDLVTSANGMMKYITAPSDGISGVMRCTNKTDRPADIGIGFFNEAGNKMEPAVKWDGIAKGAILSVQLTPRLKIYACTDYQVSQIIRGDIETEALFDENLIALPSYTEWNVTVDLGTQEIKITRT